MIGFVILNYNTWTETVGCIETIFKYTTDVDYKIYVVDNNSPKKIDEDSLKFFNSDERIEVIFHNENKGYAAGNNVGLKRALEENCSHIVICNSDILFTDDSIKKMYEFLNNTENAGIVGPQIYDKDGKFHAFYMGCKLTGIGKLKNMMLHTKLGFMFRRFERKFIIKNEITEPKKMFGVSGCCFMMTKECLDYLFPLDETTFLYEEEYIIGAILEKTKFLTYVIPNTHVIHNHGVSTGGISRFSYQCMIDSEQHYLKKYIKTPFFLRRIILFIRRRCLKRLKK
ncbi:MAG: glycosyltransferase family 2 protein [Acholeplasmatales bacterium]|nr:glycosyltransferase family 2 protein [Acholeplasmatales bacterium]